MLLDSQEFLA